MPEEVLLQALCSLNSAGKDKREHRRKTSFNYSLVGTYKELNCSLLQDKDFASFHGIVPAEAES